MNATIDPKVLEAIAKRWPEDFLIKHGFFAVLKPGMAVCAFKLNQSPDTSFPLQHEHLDLIRGRLERIVEERWGEPPDYALICYIKPYKAWVGLGMVLSLGESPYNYTEALAIAALRAEGVELGD
jgi:hypothetical protein